MIDSFKRKIIQNRKFMEYRLFNNLEWIMKVLQLIFFTFIVSIDENTPADINDWIMFQCLMPPVYFLIKLHHYFMYHMIWITTFFLMLQKPTPKTTCQVLFSFFYFILLGILILNPPQHKKQIIITRIMLLFPLS